MTAEFPFEVAFPLTQVERHLESVAPRMVPADDCVEGEVAWVCWYCGVRHVYLTSTVRSMLDAPKCFNRKCQLATAYGG